MPDMPAAFEVCIDELLARFRKYDRAVDVVSAWEMLFTTSDTELPGTVAHFERFPKIRHADGAETTPDFTVLFTDEHEDLLPKSLIFHARRTGLTSSALKFDVTTLPTQLPMPGQKFAKVEQVDVMLLVPQAIGPAAVTRIIHQRLQAPDHPYKPMMAPTIVQFGFDDSRYTMQRLLAPENGNIHDDGRPELTTSVGVVQQRNCYSSGSISGDQSCSCVR